MRESKVEAYLAKQVKAMGGRSFKWTSPSNKGVPDRIVFLPNLTAPVFVEVKAPNMVATLLQEFVHRELRSLRQRVYVVDCFEAIDVLLAELNKEQP